MIVSVGVGMGTMVFVRHVWCLGKIGWIVILSVSRHHRYHHQNEVEFDSAGESNIKSTHHCLILKPY